MARLRLIRPYLKAVARHWVWLVVAAVGAVGNGATLIGDFVVPRWAWWTLFAVGVLFAQFLAYADVSDDLADAKARLKELDTTEAKRAYLDDRIQDARSLIEDVAAQGVDWYGQNIRILADLEHWETVVRAEIRKAWGHKPAQRFAAHTETNKPDIYRRFEPADVIQKYIERRTHGTA